VVAAAPFGVVATFLLLTVIGVLRMRPLIAMSFSSAFLLISVPAVPAFAQHAGDIFLVVEDNAIVTGLHDGNTFMPDRVFAAKFGDTGFPGFTSNPGFDSFPGTFEPGSMTGFNVLDRVLFWNGGDFEPTGGETFTVSFGPLEVTTGDGPVDGFGIVVPNNGAWHRHLGFSINDDGGGNTDDGVYLLELELWNDAGGIGNADPFFIVFDQNADQAEFDAALQFVEDMIGGSEETVCPDAATIVRGIPTSGGIENLCNSDDSYWSFQPDAFAATLVAPINVELHGITTILEPAEIRIRAEAAATADGVVLRVEIFNHVSHIWSARVFPNIPQTDSSFEVAIESDAPDHVGSEGQLRSRLSFLRPAGVPPFWTIRIDHFGWNLVE